MVTTTKPSQNGTSAKPVENPNNGKDQKPVATTVKVEPLPLKPEQPKEEKKGISLEDRFYKLDQLQSLREKWEEHKDCMDKLNKFKLTYTGRTDNVTFKDANGVTFTTHNPEVVARMIEWLKDDTAKRLQEIEKQIEL